MTKSGKKTADFAEDTDGEKKSAPSVLSAVKSPAPTGRNMPAQGKERSDAALGHPSQNTSSPDGAKQGGELPRGWSEQRIEQLFAPLEDGRTLHQGWSPQCDKIPSPSEDVWGVLKTTSIQAGEFQPEHNKLLPPGLEPRPIIEVKEGDILLTCAGPRVRCGVSCLVRQTRKRLMMSGKMYRFRVNPEEHDARYIEAFLQTERARQAIDKMKTGSSDSGLNLTHERFRQLPVPVPATVDEQRRIVAEIEKQFTRLEAGVAALRRVQANLKRYRAAVLKAACEGHLVPTEAALARSPRSTKNGPPAYETGEALLARILTERRQNWQGRGQYKEPVAPDSTMLPPIPDGWTWASFDQITTLITKGSSPNWQGFNYCDDGIIFVRSENVRWGTLDLDGVAHLPPAFNEKERKSILREGDVLLNLVGASIGRAAIATSEVDGGNVNQAVAVVRLVAKKTMNQFAMLWLNSTDGQKRIHAEKVDVARANFSLEDTRVLPFPLPPLAEQTRIVAEVERRLSVVEELESVVSANLQRATRLRQSILQRAFTGKLKTETSDSPIPVTSGKLQSP